MIGAHAGDASLLLACKLQYFMIYFLPLLLIIHLLSTVQAMEVVQNNNWTKFSSPLL